MRTTRSSLHAAAPGAPARLRLAIRPTRDADRPALVELFDSLSPEARVLRFLHPATGRPDWAIDSLCRRDDDLHAGRVAVTADGRVVAVGQLFHLDGSPARAELAVTVAPSHQRRGAGEQLLHALAEEACRRGLVQLTYVASPLNRPAIALMRKAGARSRFVDGLVEGAVDVSVLLHRTARGCAGPARAA